MFFALGVLVAGLLGLMILPALWRRAVRLSTRRLEMQVPLSMEEVLADRDLLRAEFAVRERKLEARLEQEQEARTRDRAELGGKLAALEAQSETLRSLRADFARLESMLAEKTALATDYEAQLGAAMVEVYDGVTAREKYDLLSLETQRQKRLANDRQLVIAGLEARLATLEAQTRDLQRDLAEREKLLVARQTVLDRVTEERDRARAELTQYSQSHMALRSQIEARDRRIADLDEAQAELARKLAAAERKRSSSVLPADDAGLRRSIEDLGAEVLRIAQALEKKPEDKAAEKSSGRKRASKDARASVG